MQYHPTEAGASLPRGKAFPHFSPVNNLEGSGPASKPRGRGCRWLLGLVCSLLAGPAAAAEPLEISAYATASDVLQFLAPAGVRETTLRQLQELRITRVFLEGRRGDEYAPPQVLAEVRDFLARQGIQATGGIATVPGAAFGTRQEGGLGWLNWESRKTQEDVAAFFTENAPVFPELIVDDFFCTGDVSAGSDQARGGRSWADYRRDLMVSLIQPLVVGPARRARPGAQLIIKFPQWYDRFHQFGYDPARMAPFFDQVWVGTEVRNPQTRRMGFVPPTEGYLNYRWIASITGRKIRGAWFDHIECTPQNYLDQAAQSVLAGARELTLFQLGDLAQPNPLDALLASRWPGLLELAASVARQPRRGMAYYKPPNSEAEDNLYLAEHLGMIGLPLAPESQYPVGAQVIILPAQAAADARLLEKARRSLAQGATLVFTPALIRRIGPPAARLAGVTVGTNCLPATTTQLFADATNLGLATPLDCDASVTAGGARVRLQGTCGGQAVPLLSEQEAEGGRVLVLNTRTFSEADFRAAGEYLLCPRPLGLADLPRAAADALRGPLLQPLGMQMSAPAGVGLYLFEGARCLYNFRDEPVRVQWDGQSCELPANAWRWIPDRP
jgi:hypothetical protein